MRSLISLKFGKFEKFMAFNMSAESAPNTVCTRLGVGPAFFESFLAAAESRFEGESTLPPQAGNASR